MGMAQIVATEPVMDTNGEKIEVEDPADQIGTILWAELLTPAPVLEEVLDLRHCISPCDLI